MMARLPNFTTRRFEGNAYCPVTGNFPTRMIEATFRRMCELAMADGGDYCRIACRGKILPSGLEFVDVNEFATKTKEKDVGKVNYVTKDCEICGELRSVRSHFNRNVCTICSNMLTMAKAKPDILYGVLVEMYPDEYGEKQTVAGGELDDLLKVNSELRGKLAESDGKVIENQITLDAYAKEIDGLRRDLEEIERWREELVDTVALELRCDHNKIDIATEVSLLKQKYDSLLEEHGRTKIPVCATEIHGEMMEVISFTRDTVILDIAIDIMDGKITGIDADRLRALR